MVFAVQVVVSLSRKRGLRSLYSLKAGREFRGLLFLWKRDGMVLVRGWSSELLIPQNQERHVSSIDVTLALDQKELTEAD